MRHVLLSILLVINITAAGYPDWLSSPYRGHRGWYGYEVKEKKKKKKKETKEKKNIIRWPSAQKLYSMKVEQIRKWINRAADEAISHPTQENIKRWIEYMRVADRKATEFAGMWAWVMQNNPDLYRESALYPSVVPGNRAYWRTVWKSIKDMLRKKSKDYALIFFSSDDPFSSAQRQILSLFSKDCPEWIVKEVKLTPKISRKFGVKYAPQIFILSKRKKQAFPLAAGVISMNNLEKRIYHTILVLEGKMPAKLFPGYPF